MWPDRQYRHKKKILIIILKWLNIELFFFNFILQHFPSKLYNLYKSFSQCPNSACQLDCHSTFVAFENISSQIIFYLIMFLWPSGEIIWPGNHSIYCWTLLTRQSLNLLLNFIDQAISLFTAELYWPGNQSIYCRTLLTRQSLYLLLNVTDQAITLFTAERYWPGNHSIYCWTLLTSQSLYLLLNFIAQRFYPACSSYHGSASN